MMALMGLFLAVFLVVHLSINLLVLRNDGGESYQKAVEFMTSNILIKIMEIFLFGSFALHILYGIVLQIQNWLARPVRYVKTNNSQTSFFFKIHDTYRTDNFYFPDHTFYELLFCKAWLGIDTRRSNASARFLQHGH